MNCESTQNRLLALPDLTRVPGELRGHLDGCPACRAFLARAVRLDRLVAAVPVPPSSAEAKAALLERVAETGPVITHVPVVRSRDSASMLLANGRWRYAAAALAAAVLVAVGWVAFRGQSGADRPTDSPTVAGHELLKKTIGNVVTDRNALARADTPQQRMQVWTAVTGNLRDEVNKVYRYAAPDDLESLARLFDKAARRGLLEQARLAARDQVPSDQRRSAFRDAVASLGQIEADAAAFARSAPPDRRAALLQIRATAGQVRDELHKLEPRLAGTLPGQGV